MRLAFAAFAAAGCLSGCAWLRSVSYAYPDPAPLLAVKPDLSGGLARRFPDYEIVPDYLKAGFLGDDGSPELRRQVGTIWVSLSLYDTETDAILHFERCCEFVSSEYAPYAMRRDPGRSCLSPVVEDVNDPEGGRVPMGIYRSDAVIRNGRLVVGLTDRRSNHARDSEPMDELIRDLAARLGPGNS